MKKSRKRMKLPNGFGSIIILNGQRRKPYCCKKTIGGHQRIIGYAETYNEAMAILVNYNAGKTIAGGTNFATVFHLWSLKKFPKVSKSTQTSYKAAFKHCIKLYDIPISLIKLTNLQAVIDELRKAGVGYPSQKKVKVLFMQLYAYAIQHDYTDKDYSVYVDLDLNNKKKPKQPFCTRQLNRIRSLIPINPYARIVLMMCFAGTRPSEFINIALNDIKIKQRYFIVTDSKTAAGRNRPVPISKKVLTFYEQMIIEAENKSSEWLVSDENGKKFTYSRFLTVWHKLMELSGCNHTPHEARHTCATWLDNAGANVNSVKRILGHSNSDITGGVYTHKSIAELRKAIDKI